MALVDIPDVLLSEVGAMADQHMRPLPLQVAWILRTYMSDQRAAKTIKDKPKKQPANIASVVASDPRFAAFRRAWPQSSRRGDRTADLVTYWARYEVNKSPRFEHTMSALEARKGCRDWQDVEKDVIPSPAAWINSQPWLANELSGASIVETNDLSKYMVGKESWGPEKLWGHWCAKHGMDDAVYIAIHVKDGKQAALMAFDAEARGMK